MSSRPFLSRSSSEESPRNAPGMRAPASREEEPSVMQSSASATGFRERPAAKQVKKKIRTEHATSRHGRAASPSPADDEIEDFSDEDETHRRRGYNAPLEEDPIEDFPEEHRLQPRPMPRSFVRPRLSFHQRPASAAAPTMRSSVIPAFPHSHAAFATSTTASSMDDILDDKHDLPSAPQSHGFAAFPASAATVRHDSSIPLPPGSSVQATHQGAVASAASHPHAALTTSLMDGLTDGDFPDYVAPMGGHQHAASVAMPSATSAASHPHAALTTSLMDGLTDGDFPDYVAPMGGHQHAASMAVPSATSASSLRTPARQALHYKDSKGKHLRAIQRMHRFIDRHFARQRGTAEDVVEREHLGGTKNTAQIKLTHPKTGHVIRLYARSMGKKSDSEDHHVLIDGEKRSHSEALLLAAQRLRHIKDDYGKEIDLHEYQKSYISSSNLACDYGPQHCHSKVVPQLTQDDDFYGFNELRTDGASGFGRQVLARDNKHDDMSDPESDREEVQRATSHYMIDDKQLQDRNTDHMVAAKERMPVKRISFTRRDFKGKKVFVQN